MKQEVLRREAESVREYVLDLYRSFHANPELAWQECNTSDRIEAELKESGISGIKKGFNGTGSGVVGDLCTESIDGPCIALRADIDALPLIEETELSYASRNKGVMHACGHDAHAAMLLGAAKILSSMKGFKSGRIRFLFQPAEEAGINSGAPAMIHEGVLQGVDAIGALHVWSGLPAGTLGLRQGPVMASADFWELVIRGTGGHGAMPHQCVDPTIAAAEVISLLQTIVSREIDPNESVVISLGKMEAGSALNIIPEKAFLSGSIRTTSQKTRSSMESRMRRIITGVCSSLRCSPEFKYIPIYPVTVNDPDLTLLLGSSLSAVGLDMKIQDMSVLMGSEDFSYYGEKVPAVMAFLGMGSGNPEDVAPHHSPRFRVNEDVLVQGSALLAAFALRYLESRNTTD